MKVIPDELVVELSRPVTLSNGSEDATEYTTIRLSEPTVEQLSQFVRKTKSENAVDAMKYLVSIVSGTPLAVIARIGVRDFYKAQEYMMAFLAPPPEDDPEGNVEGSQ